MLVLKAIDEEDFNEVVGALNDTFCSIQGREDCPGSLDRECDKAREYLGGYLEFRTLEGKEIHLSVGRDVCENNIPVTSGDIRNLLKQALSLIKILETNF